MVCITFFSCDQTKSPDPKCIGSGLAIAVYGNYLIGNAEGLEGLKVHAAYWQAFVFLVLGMLTM